jgi:hypothetical protein
MRGYEQLALRLGARLSQLHIGACACATAPAHRDAQSERQPSRQRNTRYSFRAFLRGMLKVPIGVLFQFLT